MVLQTVRLPASFWKVDVGWPTCQRRSSHLVSWERHAQAFLNSACCPPERRYFSKCILREITHPTPCRHIRSQSKRPTGWARNAPAMGRADASPPLRDGGVSNVWRRGLVGCVLARTIILHSYKVREITHPTARLPHHPRFRRRTRPPSLPSPCVLNPTTGSVTTLPSSGNGSVAWGMALAATKCS